MRTLSWVCFGTTLCLIGLAAVALTQLPTPTSQGLVILNGHRLEHPVLGERDHTITCNGYPLVRPAPSKAQLSAEAALVQRVLASVPANLVVDSLAASPLVVSATRQGETLIVRYTRHPDVPVKILPQLSVVGAPSVSLREAYAGVLAKGGLIMLMQDESLPTMIFPASLRKEAERALQQLKNGQPLDAALPPQTLKDLGRYREVIRNPRPIKREER